MKTLKKLNTMSMNLYLNTRCIPARVMKKLRGNDGQFVVDHAVVFVLIIVLGGVTLGILKNFVSTDMAPVIKNKIMEFFN